MGEKGRREEGKGENKKEEGRGEERRREGGSSSFAIGRKKKSRHLWPVGFGGGALAADRFSCILEAPYDIAN